MAYEYSEKTLMRWPVEAQAETYRLKFLHQQQETNHWKGRASAAETKLSNYQEGLAMTGDERTKEKTLNAQPL